jgi:hypothetical protein
MQADEHESSSLIAVARGTKTCRHPAYRYHSAGRLRRDSSNCESEESVRFLVARDAVEQYVKQAV